MILYYLSLHRRISLPVLSSLVDFKIPQYNIKYYSKMLHVAFWQQLQQNVLKILMTLDHLTCVMSTVKKCMCVFDQICYKSYEYMLLGRSHKVQCFQCTGPICSSS